MNRNRNLITRNWKLLALIALTAFVGCKEYKYENVIRDVVSQDGRNFQFLITDTKTGIERIYEYTDISGKSYNPDLQYLPIGDTVFICYGGLYDPSYYQNHLVLRSGDIWLEYNEDSVRARKERECFNQEYTKFAEERSKMLKNYTDQGLESKK
jgi:hypothetical protein